MIYLDKFIDFVVSYKQSMNSERYCYFLKAGVRAGRLVLGSTQAVIFHLRKLRLSEDEIGITMESQCSHSHLLYSCQCSLGKKTLLADSYKNIKQETRPSPRNQRPRQGKIDEHFCRKPALVSVPDRRPGGPAW